MRLYTIIHLNKLPAETNYISLSSLQHFHLADAIVATVICDNAYRLFSLFSIVYTDTRTKAILMTVVWYNTTVVRIAHRHSGVRGRGAALLATISWHVYPTRHMSSIFYVL